MALSPAPFLLTIAMACVATSACSKPVPSSIEELRSKTFDVTLEVERALAGGDGFSAYLVSYESAGLTVHALVAVPDAEMPEGGFPVVVANHGHHPDPPQYGITADGVDSRPGDYYRSIPGLFAAHGFLVVMPDFRGHNDSEGIEFTDGMLESSYYTEDVAALLSAIGQIDNADADNVFMWGHSMGAEVTLRTLLVTDRVRAASLWSSVGGDIWDQSYYYSRYQDPLAADGDGVPKPAFDQLRRDIAELDGEYEWQSTEPLYHLAYLRTPLIIHHAVGDRGAAYKWSERLAKELALLGYPYEFHSYPGSDHLFTGEAMRTAAARDAGFFRARMR